MDRPCFAVAIRELDRETLIDMFFFLMGILLCYGEFRGMASQDLYDHIVKKYNEDVNNGR